MLQKGFTLIELMIVVAIIGILSMFALPAYQDYTKRTYVAEGLGLASAAKMAVTEYYSSQAEWPKGNTIAGLPDADTIQAGKDGDVVQAITVADTDGLITIKYGTKVVKDGTLTLSPKANAGSVTWECSEHSKSLETKWLPSNCRHTAKEKK